VAEAVDRGFVDINNYVPVLSQGDFCWMAIATLGPTGNQLSDIARLGEIVVGTPALGGATHLLALELGKKYNVPVKLVLFQSNFDGFINQVANNGVNFTVERVSNFNQYKDKNPNIKMIGALCPSRYPGFPEIKTVAEQGINSPLIWQTILASKNMDVDRRQEITEILTLAERNLGQQEIFKLSDQTPPFFYGVSSDQHFRNNWKTLTNSRNRWRSVIRENQ
jgi:tripartite-type tricarboxylate transporter receptor subunit TctC